MEYKEAYGLRGNFKPDPTRCAKEVSDSSLWGHYHQCTRKAKYDPDENGKPTTCKVHSEAAIAARRAKQEDAQRVSSHMFWLQKYGATFFDALKEIADGHNDPRALAAAKIKEFQDQVNK